MKTLDTPLKTRDYLVVGSMLFALFFGAGNLIFPLHLGQIAGANWVPATLGFLVTGVALPLLSVLAISVTRAEGVYDVGRPLGPAFALTFMILIHATIGPLFGTPRTATIPFTVGVQPLLPQQWSHVGLLVFSALFFAAAYLISMHQSRITDRLGKLLNPLFLALLVSVFFVGFLRPLGNPAVQPVTAAYQHGHAFVSGFLEGYNTMDALAGLAFGVTVVTAVRLLGVHRPTAVAKVTAKAGLLAMSLVALIYLALILLGAMSLGAFKVAPDGGTTFSQLVTHYMGAFGQALLATLLTVTCLTTAVGLVAAFAQDFHHHFPRVSYHQWLVFMCLASFGTANFGLQTILAWSLPMLMFLYPLAMSLILLSVTSPLFKRDPLVYGFVVVFATVPALFDMVASFPAVVSQSAFGKAMGAFQHAYLPLASIGMDWLVPALIGAALGLTAHFLRPVFSRRSLPVNDQSGR